MNPKLIKARLRKIWAKREEADALAENIEIPAQPEAWLSNLNERLNAAPIIVQDSFRPVIERRIKQAREAIESGNEESLKQALFVLYQNFHRLNHDTEIMNQHEGRKKERRPEVTKWITNQLTRRPDSKSPELWADAPEWLTDQIGFDRFSKRVTAARKKLDGRK